MHKYKIPAIISGSLVSAGILATLMFNIAGFGNGALFTNVKASDVEPKQVEFSNIQETNAVMTWKTDQSVVQSVEYTTDPDNFNLFVPESDVTKNHSVDLTLLAPATTYYVRVRYGTETFTNNGVPYTFTTAGGNNSLPIENNCSYTDCDEIKANMGNGCSAINLLENNCTE